MSRGEQKALPGRTLDDFVPPHSLEAEMATLGSMMLSERAVDDVRSILTSADFYLPAHADICRAIFYLDKKKTAVDLVTLRDRLLGLNKLQEVGGLEYLIQVAESTPTAMNALHYAEIVASKAKMRRLEKAAQDILGEVRNPESDADEKLQFAADVLAKAMVSKGSRSFRSLLELTKEVNAEIDEIADSGESKAGTSTGFPDLDGHIGGLFPGELYLIAARPSIGKSAMSAAVAVQVSKSGPVAYFSLEMPAKDVTRRLIAAQAEVEVGDLRNHERLDQDLSKVYDAIEAIRSLPAFIDDAGGHTVSSIRAKCRRLESEKGKLAAVVVDYVQLVRGTKRYQDNRQMEVSEVVRDLKAMAREMDVPVIALAQVGREVERRANKRPTLADLRESGSLEADADVVMFLYRHDYYEKKDGEQKELPLAQAVEVIVAKHRNGPTGTILLGFVPPHTRFCQIDGESKEAYRARIRKKDKD